MLNASYSSLLSPFLNPLIKPDTMRSWTSVRVGKKNKIFAMVCSLVSIFNLNSSFNFYRAYALSVCV